MRERILRGANAADTATGNPSEKKLSLSLLTPSPAACRLAIEKTFSENVSRPAHSKEAAVARRKSRILTEVELEFMQEIWRAGEVTTEDVMDALRRKGRKLTDGSVRKVLSILQAKGYVSRRPQGRGFAYWAEVPKAQAGRGMVMDLVKRAFGGSAAMMVAALVDSESVSDEDLAEIKRLIARREAEQEDRP
jgi:BlaI family penicillinase repressor